MSVAPAVQRQIADSEEFSGRLEAAEFVELRPRVSGTIDKVHFADGALVRKGELLFSIDPRPFEAEAARAQAQLTSMKARFDLAQSELARAQKLLDSQAVSKQEVDQLASGQRTSQADIQGAEAALRIARLNIEYAQVRAPIAGRVSRASVTAGNVVNEQIGADDDRRHEQGLRLLRRQRAHLPAPEGREAGRQGARRCAWRCSTSRASRTRARSTSSTTASIRRPARSACGRPSTTRTAASRPD